MKNLFLLLLFLPTAAHGWGKDGHELVGNLAYRLLSPETRTVVDRILVDHPVSAISTNTPLGDVADWADQVRIHRDYQWSGALHYIDIDDAGGCPVYGATATQKKACHFVYDRDCARDVCVAGAIVNYTQHLRAAVSPRTTHQRLQASTALLIPYKALFTPTSDNNDLIQESLMFLTHFVGDIHQPLHAGRSSDRGGNSIPVSFTVPGSSYGAHHGLELHAVWDSSMILRAIHTDYDHDRDALEDELLAYILQAKKSGEIKDWLACPHSGDKACTSQWAEESWQNAIRWAYANTDGHTEVTAGTHLTDDYFLTRWPQIQHFLAVAGVRLAAALELTLAPEQSLANS